MAHLVEGLLTLACLESLQEKSRKPVDLAMLDREVAEAYPEDRLKVEVSESVTVLADTDALHQVVSNLLSNAVKYTPPTNISESSWDARVRKLYCALRMRE